MTEFAGPSASLADVVWPAWEEQQWQAFRALEEDRDLFAATFFAYGTYDGFWDVVRANVSLPEGVTVEDLELCFNCYRVRVSPSTYLGALEESVIEPIRRVQALARAWRGRRSACSSRSAFGVAGAAAHTSAGVKTSATGRRNERGMRGPRPTRIARSGRRAPMPK